MGEIDPERFGITQAPGESAEAYSERALAEVRDVRWRYGTREWFARRALESSWWVKTVSIETHAEDDRLDPYTVYVEVWGPRLFGYQFPVRKRTLDKVDAALRPDMPIHLRLVVLDGRP